MMSSSFRFFLEASPGEPLSGYDLGHIEITNGSNTWTSLGKKPDQGMMVFPSIVELLDGLKGLLQFDGQEEFEWVGVDSSFSLSFQKDAAGEISVFAGGSLINKMPAPELAAAIYQSTAVFLDEKISQMPVDDPVFEDLVKAKEEFHQVLLGLNCAYGANRTKDSL
jgi:hypothetical protein